MLFIQSVALLSIAVDSVSGSILSQWEKRKEKEEECGLKVSHVAMFSVDGLHASDIDKYLAKGKSNISMLLDTAYRYTNALTTFPSDSFPGTMAQYTGAFPRTTGVWYDDTFDKSFYAPNSSCAGPPGAEGKYCVEERRFSLRLTAVQWCTPSPSILMWIFYSLAESIL
jgi:hypothetical protein